MSEEKINKNRTYWIEKAYHQFDELLMLSLDRDKHLYEQAKQDLDTTLLIIWRFDGKLGRYRKSLQTVEEDL